MDGRSAGTRVTCGFAIELEERCLRVLHTRTVWTTLWLIWMADGLSVPTDGLSVQVRLCRLPNLSVAQLD